MKVKLQFASFSDVGRRRDDNQDRVWVDTKKSHAMFVVADGMGGHDDGDKAAETVVKAFKTQKLDLNSPRTTMNAAVVRANQEVTLLNLNRAGQHRMGSTVVAALIRPNSNEATIVNAGDSRCYLIRAGKARLQSVDHTVSAQMAREHPDLAGKLHPSFDSLTSGIGIDMVVPHIDLLTLVLEDHDHLLLCSDGLTNEVKDQRITDIVESASSIEAACAELLTEALTNGGRDNVSAILVKIRLAP